MSRAEWAWPAFAKRNVKVIAWGLGSFLFFWNGISLMEWAYELFGTELRGYGEGQRRWHRLWAIGFAAVFTFALLIDAFNTWYYRKNPHEYEPVKKKQEERKNADTYEAKNSPMRASFVESTATGDIVHRAKLSKLEQGYALWLSQSGRETQQNGHVEKFESEQTVKQYLEKNTPFRWGDFTTPAAIEKNRQANEEIPPAVLLMDKLKLSGVFGAFLSIILVVKLLPALAEDGMNNVLRSFVILLAAVCGWWVGRRCSRLFKQK